MQVRQILYPDSMKVDDLVLVECGGHVDLTIICGFGQTSDGYPSVLLGGIGICKEGDSPREEVRLKDLKDSKRFMLVINEKLKTKEGQDNV